MDIYADIAFSPDDGGWYASVSERTGYGDFKLIKMVPDEAGVVPTRAALVKLITTQWPNASLLGDEEGIDQ